MPPTRLLPAIVLALLLAVSACTGTVDGNAVDPYQRDLSAQRAQTEADLDVLPPPEPELEAPRVWTCEYEPTYNDNWHDDVICSNGEESHRPHLLPDDDFITPDEIVAEIPGYEDHLND